MNSETILVLQGRGFLESFNSDFLKHSTKGSAITDVIRIGIKVKDLHYILEDADFSKYRIKKLIYEGERDAESVIKEKKESKTNESMIDV